jgi:hypothetical protein
MTMTDPTATGYAGIIEPKLSLLDGLCRQFGVCRLDLFGSAVAEARPLSVVLEHHPIRLHHKPVAPAKAGVQGSRISLASGFPLSLE